MRMQIYHEQATAMFDGRKVRRHKNRHRIVAAMLELVRDGAISPGAEEVAERAGVGLRTVFRHFDDMDSLYREMAEAMRQELQPLVSGSARSRPTGRASSTKWWFGARVCSSVRCRSRTPPTFIVIGRFFCARITKRCEAPSGTALEAALPAALKNEREFFEALDQALSFSTWQHLRRDQKLTQEQARQTVEFAVRALVGAAGK